MPSLRLSSLTVDEMRFVQLFTVLARARVPVFALMDEFGLAAEECWQMIELLELPMDAWLHHRHLERDYKLLTATNKSRRAKVKVRMAYDSYAKALRVLLRESGLSTEVTSLLSYNFDSVPTV